MTQKRHTQKKPVKQACPDFAEVSLFSKPALTLSTLATIVAQTGRLVVMYCYKHIAKIVSAIILALSFALIDGPHSAKRKELFDFAIFAAYWVLLGVASSIGLGTGLHTFVLYLGPHIARVTLAANQCNEMPRLLPTRWTF
jgi:hypothetical protein